VRPAGEVHESVERSLEDALHGVEDVVAARVVTAPGQPLEVALLVSAAANRTVLESTVLERMRWLTGRSAEDVRLRVTVLGGEGSQAQPRVSEAALTAATRTSRPKLESVVGATRGTTFTAEVTLRLANGETATGSAAGLAAASGIDRAIAEATLNASALSDRGLAAAHIDAVQSTTLGERKVVLVSVSLLQPEEALVGVALIRQAARMEAVVRACLDAVNRRFGL
jgi:hypothetical protein